MCFVHLQLKYELNINEKAQNRLKNSQDKGESSEKYKIHKTQSKKVERAEIPDVKTCLKFKQEYWASEM